MKFTLENTSTDVVGERTHPQIKITKTYKVSGLDLSDKIKEDPERSSDDFIDLVEADLEEIRQDLTKRVSEHRADDDDVVGFSADIIMPFIELYNEIKNISFDMDISVFYDVPVSKLDNLMEDLQKELEG